MTSGTTSVTLSTYVHSIALTVSVTPTMNFNFAITVNLKAEDDTAYTPSVNIDLTESTGSLIGTLNQAISSGSGSFTVYLNSIEQKTIQAKCPALSPFPEVTTSISVTALPLKLLYENPLTLVIFT